MSKNVKKEVVVSEALKDENNRANLEYLEFSKKNAYNINNMGNDKKNRNKLILVAIIFFIIGFVVSDVLNKGGAGQSFLIGGSGDGDEIVIDQEKDNTKTETSPISDRRVSLETRDQSFGDSVFVFDVFLDRTSWIAVYEDINGQPGNILGAGILDPGNTLSYKIDLLRGTVGDAKYYVKIHPDNGDRVFNYKEDIPLNDKIYSFKTTSGRPN